MIKSQYARLPIDVIINLLNSLDSKAKKSSTIPLTWIRINSNIYYRNINYDNGGRVKFYNRENEIQRLQAISREAESKSQMTIILGRRRIGKTRLVFEAFKDKTFAYLFVSKTSDHLLSQEFLSEIQSKFDIPLYSTPKTSKEIFRMIFDYAETHPMTVVIDEFQNYRYVEPSIFSELQNIWDQKKEKTKCNLILMGSLTTLMDQIFKDRKEPLFGRADHQVTLNPFSLATTAEILNDYGISSDESLLDYMIFTGGIPKYLELVSGIKKKNFADFLEAVLFKDSLVINEGKSSLIEEFGRNYSVYFALLQLIASGKTRRSELLSLLPDVKELGGYLNNLMENFGLIKKVSPVFAPANTKNIKYQLDDYFYSFWFRFIYRNQSALEAENFLYIKTRILEEWPVHKGLLFEKVIKNHLKTLSLFNIIGSYWDRKGENEIDIVAVNEMGKILVLGECKLNAKKIDLRQLEKKSGDFIADFKSFKIYYRGFHPGILKSFLSNPAAYLFSGEAPHVGFYNGAQRHQPTTCHL